MGFQVMTFEILLRLPCSVAKKHHAKVKYLEQWLFEVRSVQGLYSEPVLREAVIKALKGSAVEFREIYGESVEGIISKLKTVYGIIASFDVLMQTFYKISQDWNEKIPAYTTRIEGGLKSNYIEILKQNRYWSYGRSLKEMIIPWEEKGNQGLIRLFV